MKRFSGRVWLTAGIAGLSVGCVAPAMTAFASVPPIHGATGQIAWKGFPTVGDFDTSAIYAANPDGSAIRQVTQPGNGIVDDLPDWSPDGSNILFERLFQPTAGLPTIPDEVMRVNADGSGLTQIGTCTGACIGNDDPSYSPDGQQIVYTRLMQTADGSLRLGVWVMDANGSDPHQITQLSGPATTEDHEPAWSPDGRSIVFTRINDAVEPLNQQALFIVPSAGGDPRQVTPWALNAGGANWSPDGAKILFESYRDCPCNVTSQVYTVAPDGSALTQLTTAGRNIEPNWSPDGTMIIYAHQPGVGPHHFPDLWEMRANGTANQPVVQTKLWESEPDWGTAPSTP